MRIAFLIGLLAIAATAQVTERDMSRLEAIIQQRMDRIESQSEVIMRATQANQEAIVALNLRLSLSDQAQGKMEEELVANTALLAEIRDEAVYTRIWFSVILVVGGILLKSKDLLAMLGGYVSSKRGEGPPSGQPPSYPPPGSFGVRGS